MSGCGESIRVMHPLFRTDQGGSIPTSPLEMRVVCITFERALALNAAWHSRLPRMGTGFVKHQPFLCHGALHDDRLFAIAIWSNPVARNLPQQAWLELRRFAIAPDAPKFTGSWMLGVMARLIRRSRPSVERLVSYQDAEVHAGTIYRAAGWVMSATTAGDEWDRPGRPRPAAQSTAPKNRWERIIRRPARPASA